MNIVVGGSRFFDDYKFLSTSLDKIFAEINEEITIISGHCRGVDPMAERYAKERGINLIIKEPQWGIYGKAADPIRNKQMLQSGDLVIAFWDGHSRGTLDLIINARKLSKPVEIIRIF